MPTGAPRHRSNRPADRSHGPAHLSNRPAHRSHRPAHLSSKEQPISTPPIPPPPPAIHPANVTTAFELPGLTLVRNFGLVRGLLVRSRNAFGTLGARFQTLFGGNISLFTELGERTRQEAFALMAQHAADLGANAIIGVRYDTNEVMQGVTEVLAYGTAVLVAPSRNSPSPAIVPPTPDEPLPGL